MSNTLTPDEVRPDLVGDGYDDEPLLNAREVGRILCLPMNGVYELPIPRVQLAGTDQLFTTPRRTIQKEHARACQLVGIHGYTIHDHRHTAAVSLARAGLPLNLLQQQLGHATIAQTMKYARFHPDYSDVKGYFERVGETLGLGESPRKSGAPSDKTGDTPKTEAR